MAPMRPTLLLSACAAALGIEDGASVLTTTLSFQRGIFQIGKDFGSVNAHDYRPQEFAVQDMVYDGLTVWDNEMPLGLDGVRDTSDDFVAPSLAISWTDNLAALKADPTQKYEITFKLRTGVTFHDGTPWNAAACKANFDQIMGGTGEPGGTFGLRGMHDWMGFTQSIYSYRVVDDVTFELVFTQYYEAALRELAFIRPFRMVSPEALPTLPEVSHERYRNGDPWLPPSSGLTPRGIAAPIGTGAYKAVSKHIVNSRTGATRELLAKDFNATCFVQETCDYGEDQYVSELILKKHADHWREPKYDYVVMRAYESHNAIKLALQNDTLDIAYGVNTISPSAFVSLATEENSNVVAHKAPHDINVRQYVLNSGGRLSSINLRKVVMGVLANNAIPPLRSGELAEEEPIDKHFDPTLPYCGVLNSLSSSVELAATASPEVTTADVPAMRFVYIKDIPHNVMIASAAISALYTAGIDVIPMPLSKDDFNAKMCDYLGPNQDGVGGEHTWDIAYSETWGPPYDATSKLWDTTHGLASGWCSEEADAPAVSNMETMPYDEYVDKVRKLSTHIDRAEREAAYADVLTTLHREAIFLPITAKRNVAVTNKRVSGFKFGYMEYDLPLANLYPTPSPPSPDMDDDDGDSLSGGAIAGIVIGSVFGAALLVFAIVLIAFEKKGKPIFVNLDDMPTTSYQKSKPTSAV